MPHLDAPPNQSGQGNLAARPEYVAGVSAGCTALVAVPLKANGTEITDTGLALKKLSRLGNMLMHWRAVSP